MSIELKKIGEPFHYLATDSQGIELEVDSSPELGGQGKGVRPMELVLIGIGGCSSIDLGLILEKQRQKFDDYKVTVSGERKADQSKAYRSIQLNFELWGDLDREKVEKAIALTTKKYCSVIMSLNPEIEITTSLTIHKPS